jgi:hypothetical protein
VCDCSDQAAHYHNLGPQLGASLLTRHIGWKQKKRERKKDFIQKYIGHIGQIFRTRYSEHMKATERKKSSINAGAAQVGQLM